MKLSQSVGTLFVLVAETCSVTFSINKMFVSQRKN